MMKSITWETFFLEIYKQNLVDILFPDPFLKNQNWTYLWIIEWRFVQFVVIEWQVEDYQSILKLSCRPLAFTSNKSFLLNKKVYGTSPLISFLHYFWRKIFLLLCFITWPNLIIWLPLLREILGNMCIVVVCEPDWRHKIWN